MTNTAAESTLMTPPQPVVHTLTTNPAMMREWFDNVLRPTPIYKNRMGGNNVKLAVRSPNGPDDRFFFQTPSMPAPFGVSEYIPTDGALKPKYSLDLSFRYADEDPKVKQFLRAMQSLDDYMIELAIRHSLEWFGKIMSPDVIRELYRPLVKVSSQPEKYKPLIKGKLRENPTDMYAWTTDDDKFKMAKFMPGTHVKVILELMPVWFMNKQFGLSLSVVRVLVTQLPSFQTCRDNGFLPGFSFIKEQVETEEGEIEDGPVPFRA